MDVMSSQKSIRGAPPSRKSASRMGIQLFSLILACADPFPPRVRVFFGGVYGFVWWWFLWVFCVFYFFLVFFFFFFFFCLVFFFVFVVLLFFLFFGGCLVFFFLVFVFFLFFFFFFLFRCLVLLDFDGRCAALNRCDFHGADSTLLRVHRCG